MQAINDDNVNDDTDDNNNVDNNYLSEETTVGDEICRALARDTQAIKPLRDIPKCKVSEPDPFHFGLQDPYPGSK